MADVVFAKIGGAYRANGEVIRVRPGEPWSSDDPFVKAHPGLFDEGDGLVRRTVEVVETATARPGETRTRKTTTKK